MAHAFSRRLAEGPLLCDGAMGTVLYSRGVSADACFDVLNLSSPQLVQSIHADYVTAGADCIETNTFGANRFKLAVHGLERQVREINRRGARLARDVRESMGRDVLVLGSIGPLGKYLAPLGTVTADEAREAFREQAEALLEGGVDGFVVETFSDLTEIGLAVEAIRAVTDLPIVAQMAFTDEGVTFTGRGPGKVARTMRGLAVEAFGANCSVGSSVLQDVLERMAPEAGGLPLEFPTISLGEVFLSPTSLVFRNLMAMDVEECIRAYPMDSVVLLSGCDKTTPAMLMGAASADVPAIMVTGGPMLRGKWRTEELGSGTDLWRLWAEHRADRLTEEELCEAESCMSRSSGHCMVMGTASTMASMAEALGMTLPGNAAIPAPDSRRLAMAEMAGRRAVDIQKTMTIHAPIERVFEVWSDLEGFPRFLSRVREVRRLGEDRSRWTIELGAEQTLTWEAQITVLEPGRRMAWKSLPGPWPGHSGIVRFDPEGSRTRMHLQLSYTPPAGMVGHAAGAVVGVDAKRLLDEELLRFKRFVETGEVAHDAAGEAAPEPGGVTTRGAFGHPAQVAEGDLAAVHPALDAAAGVAAHLHREREVEPALKTIDETLRRDPIGHDWFWDVRGTLLASIGKYQEALDALSREGRKYRIAYMSSHTAGQRSAILADLAIAPLPKSFVADDLVCLSAKDGLPELGTYNIEAQTDEGGSHGNFEVAEYKKPEYKVNVTTPKQFVPAGGKTKFDISARYFFGAPVADAEVKYYIYRSAYYPYFADGEEFEPAEEDEDEYSNYGNRYSDLVDEGEGKLDASGQMSVEFDVPESNKDDRYDFQYRIEAQVTDSSRSSINASANLVATRGSVIATARPDQYVFHKGDFAKIAISTTDYEGRPVPAKLSLKFTLRTWTKVEKKQNEYDPDYQMREHELSAIVITTNREGEAVYEYQLPVAGGIVPTKFSPASATRGSTGVVDA